MVLFTFVVCLSVNRVAKKNCFIIGHGIEHQVKTATLSSVETDEEYLCLEDIILRRWYVIH